MKVRIYVAVAPDGSYIAMGAKNASEREGFLPDGAKEVDEGHLAECADELGPYQVRVVEADVPDFEAAPVVEGTVTA